VNVSGVFPPIATPFDARGDIDRAALQSNIARWLTSDIRGIVALGSNGEAPLLDESESDAVIEAAREIVPRDRLLIAGTGRESTRGTIAASQRAASLGADAVLVRTPSYFKPRMTRDALADAKPDSSESFSSKYARWSPTFCFKTPSRRSIYCRSCPTSILSGDLEPGGRPRRLAFLAMFDLSGWHTLR